MISRGWDLFYYIFWGFLGVAFAQEFRLWWQQLLVVLVAAIFIVPYYIAVTLYPMDGED